MAADKIWRNLSMKMGEVCIGSIELRQPQFNGTYANLTHFHAQISSDFVAVVGVKVWSSQKIV